MRDGNAASDLLLAFLPVGFLEDVLLDLPDRRLRD